MSALYYAIAIGLIIGAFLTLCIAVNRYRAGYRVFGILTGVTIGVAVMLMVIAS